MLFPLAQLWTGGRLNWPFMLHRELQIHSHIPWQAVPQHHTLDTIIRWPPQLIPLADKNSCDTIPLDDIPCTSHLGKQISAKSHLPTLTRRIHQIKFSTHFFPTTIAKQLASKAMGVSHLHWNSRSRSMSLHRLALPLGATIIYIIQYAVQSICWWQLQLCKVVALLFFPSLGPKFNN